MGPMGAILSREEQGGVGLQKPRTLSEPRGLRREERGGVDYICGELWTARQRQSHSLHEVSYRACFKPELPRFFIEQLTKAGELVLDPFMGRGTTPLEARLMGRAAAGSDANPLGAILARPRLAPPELGEVSARVSAMPNRARVPARDAPLLAFYHPETLSWLVAWKNYFLRRERAGRLDAVDDWVRMAALTRLSGHSPGFFSVRTMPPNQAVSVEVQRKLNARAGLVPPRRDVSALTLRKSRALLRDGPPPPAPGLPPPLFAASEAHDLGFVPPGSVSLAVTSPPFLDTVDYRRDNWLRLWFTGLSSRPPACTALSDLGAWRDFVAGSLRALARAVRRGGHVAFEVGEVRGGTVALEREVLAAARGLPLAAEGVYVHEQLFTKTAHCWGVDNNRRGTNSNRIVLFRRR